MTHKLRMQYPNELAEKRDAYQSAAALVEKIDAELKELEVKYIHDHKIVSPDGVVPQRIYCIDWDDAEFDRHNLAFAEIQSVKELEKSRIAAKKALIKAEDELIDHSISLVPDEQRKVLERNKKVYKWRQKMIEIAVNFDCGEGR